MEHGWAPGRAAQAAELDCLIQPRETVTVSAPAEGIVDQVRVDRGDLVEKGAVLAVLESSLERQPWPLPWPGPSRTTRSTRARCEWTSAPGGSSAPT